MAATIEFFPVDNGDMVLLTLDSGRRILIDVNIRKDADDDTEEDIPDVAQMLKDRLDRDDDDRLFIDAFLLSHPDADHCRGLERHFHLGTPGSWKKKDDKIFIREMWSSPIVFRRQNDIDGELCDDANAWWKEARRRVAAFRTDKSTVSDGDRILILGADKDGKTDDLDDIRVDIDAVFSKLNGQGDKTFEALLLGPLPVSEDEDEEQTIEKNHSSVVLRFKLHVGSKKDIGRYLTGGDAGVAIWERLWKRHKKTPDNLSYDVLLTPHHCSWRTLSYDSWSDKDDDAEVNSDARSALAQARDGAHLISSSKEIKDDDDDPPCIGAKREYEDIAESVDGQFLCVANDAGDDVLVIEVTSEGPKPKGTKASTASAATILATKSHSQPAQADKVGGGRYA